MILPTPARRPGGRGECGLPIAFSFQFLGGPLSSTAEHGCSMWYIVRVSERWIVSTEDSYAEAPDRRTAIRWAARLGGYVVLSRFDSKGVLHIEEIFPPDVRRATPGEVALVMSGLMTPAPRRRGDCSPGV